MNGDCEQFTPTQGCAWRPTWPALGRCSSHFAPGLQLHVCQGKWLGCSLSETEGFIVFFEFPSFLSHIWQHS